MCSPKFSPMSSRPWWERFTWTVALKRRALIRRALPECGDAAFAPPPRDPKSRLNEWAHAQRLDPPRYCTIADSGAEGGDGRFAVMVLLEGRAVGEGNGRTKRAAENAAAGSALAQLDPAAAGEAAL